MTNIIYNSEQNSFNFTVKSLLTNEYYNIIIKYINDKQCISIVANQTVFDNNELFQSEYFYMDFKEYLKTDFLFYSCNNINEIFNKLKNIILEKDIVQIILNKPNNEQINIKIRLIKKRNNNFVNIDDINNNFTFVLKKEKESKGNYQIIIKKNQVNNAIINNGYLNNNIFINQITSGKNKEKNIIDEDDISSIDKELNSKKNIEERYPKLIKNLMGKIKENKKFKSDISNYSGNEEKEYKRSLYQNKLILNSGKNSSKKKSNKKITKIFLKSKRYQKDDESIYKYINKTNLIEKEKENKNLNINKQNKINEIIKIDDNINSDSLCLNLIINKKYNDLYKSVILSNKKEMILILDNIKNVNKNIESEIQRIKLVYRATSDGSSFFMFHQKCDKINDNILLIKTNQDIKFGAYTKKDYEPVKYKKKYDPNSFLFNLNEMKIFGIDFNNDFIGGVYSLLNNGPCFINNAIMTGKHLLNDLGSVGKKNCGYNFKFDYELNCGNPYFKPTEIEIFQIMFEKIYELK